MADNSRILYENPEAYYQLSAKIIKAACDDYKRILRKLHKFGVSPSLNLDNPLTWSLIYAVGRKSLSQQETLEDLLFEKENLEDFFHGGWFSLLSSIDGDKLMNRIRDMSAA